jgi:thiol-disulfide isomerase/thioredoxin
MQRSLSISRHALAAFTFLLAFVALACQPKSAPDNSATKAPDPKPSVATSATVTPAQPAAVSTVPATAPTPHAGPLAATQGQDFELVLLDASKLKLSKLLGRRKVVVINFWATWCGPCRREIPELIALQKDYQQNKDVEILGLSVEDPQQFREQVKGLPNNSRSITRSASRRFRCLCLSTALTRARRFRRLLSLAETASWCSTSSACDRLSRIFFNKRLILRSNRLE